MSTAASQKPKQHSMYGLIGCMVAVPGERENLIAILREGTLHLPGCISYQIARDADDDNSIWITEIWDSKESHEASLSLPSVRKAISVGRPLIAGIRERFETQPVRPAHSFKPAGQPSVSPYLIVRSADRTIEMTQAVFGAVMLRRISGQGDRVIHAEVQIDDTVVMMGEAHGDGPSTPAHVHVHVHVYVPDVDAVYGRALEAGLESVDAPAQKDGENRRGAFRDRDGIIWWVSTRVAHDKS